MQKQPKVTLAVWTAPTLLLWQQWKQHKAGDKEKYPAKRKRDAAFV